MNRPRVLYDAGVLIDVLRGHAEALRTPDDETRPALVSTLVSAELHAGVRDGVERVKLGRLLGLFDAALLASEDGVRGGLWRRDWGRSHGTGLVDALLAAQAERLDAELVTLNAKHFPMLSGTAIRVPYRKP